MSKNDKKKYTLKYFDEKIKTNLFLQNYYRPRLSYYNKIRHSCSYIIFFKLNDNFV